MKNIDFKNLRSHFLSFTSVKRLCNLYETTFSKKKDIQNPLIYVTTVTRRFRRNSGQ